jgi:multisubunit Na+/H+ antiporter MnhF subunit
MNEWELVAAILGVALLPCLLVGLLSGVGSALVALELAGTLTSTILMVLSEGLQRQPFVDLAVVLAFLSLVGALALARLLERDL